MVELDGFKQTLNAYGRTPEGNEGFTLTWQAKKNGLKSWKER